MEHTFYANNMEQDQFVNYVNNWFFNNRNIKVTKLYTSTSTKFGLLVNKSALSDITIIYDQNNRYNNFYGFDYNEQFALMKISMEAMVAKWKQNNPHLQAVSYTYNYHGRGQTGSLFLHGIGASNRNQLWMIYKVPQNIAPAAPAPAMQQVPVAQSAPVMQQAPAAPYVAPAPVNAPRRCGSCGLGVDATANFCMACGAKL